MGNSNAPYYDPDELFFTYLKSNLLLLELGLRLSFFDPKGYPNDACAEHICHAKGTSDLRSSRWNIA